MESVTEQQISEVVTMLSAVLAPNNTVRKQQESLLLALRKNHPNEFVICLLKILSDCPDQSLKVLASVLLRQIFSSLHPSLQTWNHLNAVTQGIVKAGLLQILEKESTWVLSKRIGETISELAVLLLSGDNPTNWPELLSFLLVSFTGQPKQVASSLHILSGLCTFYLQELLQKKDSLLAVCKSSLESNELEVKVSCIEFLSNFLGLLEKEEMLAFGELLPFFLRAIIAILGVSEKDGEEALKNLRDLAETEPKYFKSKLDISWDLVNFICEANYENLGIKYLAIDFIVSLAGRLENEFKSNKTVCDTLLSQIFKVMVSIDSEVEDSWATPPEGFEDEEDQTVEIDYAKQGRKQITRLVEGLGEEFLLPTVLGLIQSALSAVTEDWRVKYAALMAISELGQFIEESQKIAELVPILIKYSTHTHPKIRYAAYNCIGQLSEDYEEEFQTNHHSQVVPVLIQGIQDPVARVKAEAAESLSKFMENCTNTLAISYIPVIMPVVVGIFSNPNCSLVLESALSALTSISETSKEAFGSWYSTLMPYFLNIINTYTSDDHKRLRGKAIECMTTICTAVSKEVFSQHSAQVIGVLKQIQDTQLKENDSLKAYILSAWQRLAATLQEEFSQYVDGILPSLLNSIALEASISISSQPEEVLDLASVLNENSSSKVSVSTADLEDKDIALQALLTIIDVLKGSYAPWIEQTAKLIVPLVGYTANPGIREVSATILASLVISAKSGGQDVVNLSKAFLGVLWQTTLTELDTEGQVSKLEAIKTIIETVGLSFLSSEEVNVSGENLIKILENSLAHRKRLEDAKALGEDSESEDELINEINKKEEDSLHTSISEVLGALFKTHKEYSLTIVNFLYSNVLSKFLTPASSTEDHKFAIFVIDDVIEFLGEAMAGDKWNALAEALFVYAVDTDDSVRQAAVYGIGVFATFTSGPSFNPWASRILGVLDQAIQIPVQKSKKSHGHARDNAISSIGKIIKHQSANIDLNLVVPAFVSVLPIKHDKVEARLTHDLLADLCLSHSTLAFGANYERLGSIVKLFAEILETKLCDAGTVPKIKQIIQILQSSNISILPGIVDSLTDLQKSKINKALAN